MSSSPIVNGDKPSSQFISHLTSYPVVSDSIETFKSNPYGARSIEVADSSYNTLVKPVLPYAQKPYTYIHPYVSRADELASSGLSKVDSHFPIVKEDTQKIKGTIIDYVFSPLVMVGKGREYVQSTYGSEYHKCGGDGYVAGGKAMITTGLVVTSDVLGWVSGYLSQKKGEAKSAAKDATSN